MQLDQNTCLYLFSALLQADAAIISIVGIFVIFRIQMLQSQVENILRFIRHGSEYNALTFELDVEFREKILSNKSDSYHPYYKKCQALFENIQDCKTKILYPTIFLILGILLCILGMLYSKYFYTLNYLFFPAVFISSYHSLLYVFIAYRILMIINGGEKWKVFPKLEQYWNVMRDFLSVGKSKMKQLLRLTKFWGKDISAKN